MNYFGEIFSPLFSDLCGLCPSTLLRVVSLSNHVFAEDNPSFGCALPRWALPGELSLPIFAFFAPQ
jgi:hypothetical protein